MVGAADDQGGGLSTALDVGRFRGYLESVLAKVPDTVKKKGKDIGIKIICDEVRKIPVPILPSALATAIDQVFRTEYDSERAFEDIIEMLNDMRTSDEEFETGLRGFRIALWEVKDDIALIERLVVEQHVPHFRVVRAAVRLEHPVSENEVHLVLANTGGGSVMVEEICLDVEEWEPDTSIEYTFPAAPMHVLYLKARLSVHEKHYPLFALNEVTPRIFNERGMGAEKVIIQLSSCHNAVYKVRLRIPYEDLTTSKSDTLSYPPSGESAILLPFCYAPGWCAEPTPEDLLGRKEIFDTMKAKFQTILATLEHVHESAPGNSERLDRMLVDAGVPGPMQPFIVSGWFNTIIPVFLSIAGIERDNEAERLATEIGTHLSEYVKNDRD